MSKDKVQIFVGASKEQHEQIKERASAVGFSVSRFMRELGLNGYVIQRNVIELQRLIWEINKIGVNINQIAKVCNESGVVSPLSMKLLEDEHAKVWGLLDDILSTEDGLFVAGKSPELM